MQKDNSGKKQNGTKTDVMMIVTFVENFEDNKLNEDHMRIVDTPGRLMSC